MVTLGLAIVLWSAIGGRLGLMHAREDVNRQPLPCALYGVVFGALFGAMLGSFWLLFVSWAGVPVN